MKPLAFAIIRVLSDNEFHSGPDIARVLGVSRASVSNALRDVDEVGLTLYKVPGRGYRLLDPVQWLERDKILEHLGTDGARFDLEVLDTVDLLYEPLDPEEKDELGGEVYPLPDRGDELDLRPALRDELVLRMPEFVVCEEGCRGLCPKCGANRNRAACECVQDEPEGPWDALKTIKFD